MSVADVLKARLAEVLTFRLNLRPMALKNSRINTGRGYTIVNKKAAARLATAKYQLMQQHEGGLLEGCFDLTVQVFYSDLRSWLDSDAVLTFVQDALKGVVVKDDAPKYLRDCESKPRLSRQQQDYLEIELREVVPC